MLGWKGMTLWKPMRRSASAVTARGRRAVVTACALTSRTDCPPAV